MSAPLFLVITVNIKAMYVPVFLIVKKKLFTTEAQRTQRKPLIVICDAGA